MRCLEVNVSYRCDEACVFCSHAGEMAEFGRAPIAPEELKRVLVAKRSAGFGHLTFTGGEPTLYPRLWRLLAVARGLGFRTRVVTNGQSLSVAENARRLLPHLDELCLSLHGPDAEVHDAATRTPGSFAKMMRAFDRVEAHPGPTRVVVNTAVTRLNASRLVETAALAGRRAKVAEYWVSALVPIGDGLARYEDLAVRNARALEQADEVVRAAAPARVRFYGFPFCALGGREEQATAYDRHPAVSVFRAWDAEGRPCLREADTLDRDPPRVLAEPCLACAHRQRCGGPWKRYHEVFGGADLRAVTDRAISRGSAASEGRRGAAA